MNTFLIIVASGKGLRLDMQLPKQFIMVNNKTVLEHTLEKFTPLTRFKKVIITLPPDVLAPENSNYADLKERLLEKNITLIPGGKERFDSVYNALSLLQKNACNEDFVFIHDGVRPFVSKSLLEALFSKIPENNGIIPLIPLTDTIKEIREGAVARTLDRSILRGAQTPQVFNYEKIFNAYLSAKKELFMGTDDASIFEHFGNKVIFIKGCNDNIKITTPHDLEILKRTFAKTRIGHGYDVHRLSEDRALILCGETIPHTHGLLGHSDADVPVHALMDALLGAAALGDIGEHFPDTEPQFKNASSLVLLKQVYNLLRNKGYKINNIDLTIVAEKPRLQKYKEKMKENISSVLDIQKESINIKATTTEGLGFEGQCLGISAHAVTVIES